LEAALKAGLELAEAEALVLEPAEPEPVWVLVPELPELPEPELEEPEPAPEPVWVAPAELELSEAPEEEAPELEAPVLAAVEEPAPEEAEEPWVEVTMVVGVEEAAVVESWAEEVSAGEASVTEVGAAVVVVLRALTALEPVNLIESEEPDMSDQV
jgi:hypothetical protein